jgi:hypothetical protein
MKRLAWMILAFAGALGGTLRAATVDISARAIKICVADNASPEVKKCANDILAAVSTSPLLVAMGGSAEIVKSGDLLTEDISVRAYNHLILVGLADDPVIQLVWQREAKAEEGGFYIFDFGHLRGDIGYIESNRNPFLHSQAVAAAPFETEIVTITGSTNAAVVLATDAFLKAGLVNGVVGGPGWQRPRPTILDHDPLAPGFEVPSFAPAKLGDAVRIGVTQAGESEYRGVLQDTGVKPKEMWRFKYFVPGGWDGAGYAYARADYLAGLHRRAFGNTLWLARFANATEAQAAISKIAEAAKLKPVANGWAGLQPALSMAPEDAPGPLGLWQHGEWVVMSTLREATNDSALVPGSP